MFGRIAAQQAGPARSDGYAPRHRVRHCLSDQRIGRQAQIVVGGKVAPGTRHQTAQAAALFKSRELRSEGFAGHGAPYRPARGRGASWSAAASSAGRGKAPTSPAPVPKIRRKSSAIATPHCRWHRRHSDESHADADSRFPHSHSSRSGS